MFLRILARAVTHRRGRIVIALVALVVGAAVTAAMLSIYYDAGYKMRRELRAYGANVMLAPAESASFIDESSVDAIQRSQGQVEIAGAAPFLYLVGHLGDTRVILTGTRFDQARRTSPWWQISGRWPDDAGNTAECVVGVELARQFGLKEGDSVTVGYTPSERQARMKSFAIAGLLTTGGPEDNQILASLREVQGLGSLEGRITAVAISAVGERDQVESFANEISARFTGVRANPVRQIAESEGRLLVKLKLMMFLIAIMILGAAGLSISTTLTALVLERRPEIGTMKALGADESKILSLFLCELAGLGIVGGVIGYALGIAIAQPIGRSLFNSAVSPRLVVVIAVMAISIVVALLSGLIPVRKIREIEPAIVLKGE